MRRLTGLDPMFFYLETPTTHMTSAFACIFDPSTAPEEYSFARVRKLFEERLHLLPPFRRRLVEVPLGLDHPRWVEDPVFDLDYHLRRVAIDPPGGVAELAEFCATSLSKALDRSRPPWELYVIEGLQGGLVASLTKVHHSAIDGVSGEGLVASLLDLSPQPTVVEPPPRAWEPERIPSRFELIGQAIVGLGRRPAALARLAWHGAGTGRGLLAYARRAGTSAVSLPVGAPTTSLGARLGYQRRVAFAQVSFEEVENVSKAFGVTVNDVVLAMCSGALRRYLFELNERPKRSLVAIVPVSVRGEDERWTLGNRLSFMFVSLASTCEDPLQRLLAISRATQAAKAEERAAAFDVVGAELVEAGTPALFARAAGFASRLGVVGRLGPGNLIVSNIVGSPVPLYFAGAQLLAAYPIGPVVDGIGLNITVQSYRSSLQFGLISSPNTVGDLWRLADGLGEALRELTKTEHDGL